MLHSKKPQNETKEMKEKKERPSTWFISACIYSRQMNLYVSIHICPTHHFEVTHIPPCPNNWQRIEKNHVQGGLKVQPVNKGSFLKMLSL